LEADVARAALVSGDVRLVVASLVLLAACGTGGDGGGGGGDDDAVDGGRGGDAAPVECPAAPALEVGVCMRDGTTPCTGEPGEPMQLVEHVAGGEVPLVVGPQGLSMVVFGARTAGIALGDPSMPDAPGHPELRMVARVDGGPDDGTEVAYYDGYPVFADAGGGEATVNGQYLVILGPPDTLDHLAIEVEATLTDREGTVRCGATTMVLVPWP
jgi:hypothetical protein